MTAAAAGGRLGRAALVGSTSLVAPRPRFSPLVSPGDPADLIRVKASLLLVGASMQASLKRGIVDPVLGLVASHVDSRGDCSSLLFEPILSSAAALQNGYRQI